jgi:hypothetical protein
MGFGVLTCAYKLPIVIAAGRAGGTTMVIKSAASRKMSEADTFAKI